MSSSVISFDPDRFSHKRRHAATRSAAGIDAFQFYSQVGLTIFRWSAAIKSFRAANLERTLDRDEGGSAKT